MRRLNQAGLDLIKSFEGCKLTAYRDSVGVLTIGYGHTGPDVYEGEVITQDQADNLLENDIQRFCNSVENMVTVDLSNDQFAALVDFAYNVGPGNLKSSTLLKKVNNHEDPSAEFLKWNKAGGQVLAGLTRRRQAEVDLYNQSDDSLTCG